MGLALVLVLSGLALLVFGGDALVRGASGIALLARLSPALVALTIVSAGTSMPELVVSLQAALTGKADVAVGNVVGSNVFNVAAILGLAALIRPLRIRRETLRAEWPVMMGAAVAFALMLQDAVVSRAEGALLCLGLVAFIAWAARSSARPDDEGGDASGDLVTASFGRTGARAVATNLGAVAAGVAALAAGSHLLVQGAVTLATGLGVSELVVGLTVVAAGTSAPELVTSLVASWRGRDDIAVGNVVGSNIFNVLCIMGATAAITPVPVPAEVLSRDVWWMLGVSAALLPLALTGMRIQRLEGAALVAAFVAYTASLLV